MNENQNLPIQKDETIAKLYALRAGLSVIAENMEQIEELRAGRKVSQEVESIRSRIDYNRWEQQNLRQQPQNSRNARLRELDELQDSMKDFEEKYIQSKEYIKTVWKQIAIAVMLLGFSLFLLIHAGIIRNNNPWPSDPWVSRMFWGILLLISGFATFPWSKLSTYKNIKSYIVAYKNKMPTLQNRVDQLNHECESPNPKSQNSSALKRLKKEESSLLLLLEEALQRDAEQTQKSEEQENALIEESEQIYSSLISTYSPFIVESDWENIDLLIFYLETGRAETWKEALQLMDRQMQTNQITNAIEQASTAISKSMLRSTQALGSLINQSFSAMSYQQQSLLSESRLHNALLEQANMSSERLMEEVRLLQFHP